MIKLTATALIHYISPVLQVSDNFQKRELILDDSWVKDGKTYPNYVLIEFTGDKMAQLDSYAPGQRITVEAFVNGREYQGRYFNSLRGQSVTLYQPQQQSGQTYPAQPTYPQQPSYPPAPAYPQQASFPQQPAYPQQTAYPQQGSYAQPPAPAPMPASPQGGNLGPDGLPFR